MYVIAFLFSVRTDKGNISAEKLDHFIGEISSSKNFPPSLTDCGGARDMVAVG